jgi:beta-glucosidase
MGAYNRVNGVYCCENKPLLSDILRGEWGFDGFTMSDFMWGVHDTAGALKAGLDVEMPTSKYFNYFRIKKSIKKGELTEEHINQPVKNILSVLIRQTPNIKPQSKTVMKCAEHLELAEEAAVKGMVLLKNENSLLPLATTTKIAVVGPYADAINVGDKGSNMIITKDGITAYNGLSKIYPNVQVYNGLDPQKALVAAAQAEAVIACIGCDSKDEGEFMINVGEKMTIKPRFALGGDRDYLYLNPSHLELLQVLKKAGKKVIAVLYTGSVILTENFEAYTDVIIMGYYGGIRFGDALACLVCGEKNFSGKLPVSIAQQESDYPPFLEIGQKPYEVDYGYYNGYYLFEKDGIQPSYPFGFGLSYTNFEFQNIRAARNGRGGITVNASVRNSGAMSGAEVVQVYVGSAGAVEHRPLKMLRGFKRVELEPGESQSVEITIDVDDLKFYRSEKKTWELDPSYRVYVGNSSADVNLAM